MSQQPRRSSFGTMLLRRSKSGDLGTKGGKKAQAAREAELERQRQAASRIPPKLPEFNKNTEQLSQTIGTQYRPSSDYERRQPVEKNYSTSPPVPPIPANAFDPYARTESMAHRGRYSYASSAVSTINSPRRVRRRKDPTPLNILILGTRNSGKTSFLEFLKTALALPPKKRAKDTPENEYQPPASGNFIPHFLETEIDGERIGLTLWDSEGLEKNVVDLQLREMSAFLESKFEDTFTEEMKVVRSPGVQDTHIHAAFLVLDPASLDRNIAVARSLAMRGHQHDGKDGALGAFGALDDDINMQVLRMLKGKTTTIPVISKADTVTTAHMNVLKKIVWDSLKKSDLDPLEALGLDDDGTSVSSGRIDEEDEDLLENGRPSAAEDSGKETGDDEPVPSSKHKRMSSMSIRHQRAQEASKDDEMPFLPFSIISPDLYEPSVMGRRFPWGFADPYDETHCDFVRLKEAVFSEWRGDLREASREQWYEGWRTSKLNRRNLPYRR